MGRRPLPPAALLGERGDRLAVFSDGLVEGDGETADRPGGAIRAGLHRAFESMQRVMGDFAKLAKKYSKDPGSAAQGGKLTISKGQTVPPFDKTAFSLKTGELSQPIKTQYGYHIIQALSAVKPAKSTPLAKVQASIKQQLEQQRKNESMTKWVDDKKKQYCKSGIKYQIGYQPNPDPCATLSGSTTTTSQ